MRMPMIAHTPLARLSARRVSAVCCTPRASISFSVTPKSPPIVKQPPSLYADFKLPREMPPVAATPTRGDAVLPNRGNVAIAAVDDHGPAATLAVLVPWGSRHETPESLGSSYMIKCSAFQNKNGMSAYYIAYESENRGVTLKCSLGRDHMIYTASFLREKVDFSTKLLTNIIRNPNLQYYAYKNAVSSSKYLSSFYWANNANTAIESAFACAFRNAGLGNPTALQLDAPTPSFTAFTEFLSMTKTIGKGSVISAVGIGFDELKHVAETELKSSEQAAPAKVPDNAPSTRYYGGSARIQRKGSNVLLPAFEGARAADIKDRATLELIATLVLSSAGTSSVFRDKYSSLVNKFTSKALNESFADTGLFGFLIESDDPKEVTAETARIVEALHQLASGKHALLGSESFEGVQRRAALAYSERTDALRAPAAVELARAKAYGYLGSNSVFKQIQETNSADVVARAKALLSKNSSFVAVGQLARLPYADDVRLPTGTSGSSGSSKSS